MLLPLIDKESLSVPLIDDSVVVPGDDDDGEFECRGDDDGDDDGDEADDEGVGDDEESGRSKNITSDELVLDPLSRKRLHSERKKNIYEH